MLLDVRNLSLMTPDERRLCCIESLTVKAGERVGLVGRNGCGKTTLLRAIVERWSRGLSSESIRFNASGRLGYYDQDLKHFGATERVMEAVVSRCGVSVQRVTAELVGAGFEYARHSQLVSTLSGGERARLTMLLLKLQEPHMLILDEPTNHLDVEGIEQLESSLISGGQTVLFVSHDRWFLEAVATRIFDFSALV
jgi:ATPase subunit of ABC transporter with duplicated ATPase domains